MTPSRYYSLNDMKKRLPVNFTLGINGTHIAVRDGKGCLLRGFMLHYVLGQAERINADDFDKWWQFMGFDQC